MIKPIKHYIEKYYKQYRDAVDEIVTNFDYEKIQKAMEALDWEWRDEGVPGSCEIREVVISRLLEIEDRISNNQTEYFSDCGGIEVECRSYDFEKIKEIDPDCRDDFNRCVYIGCKFVLESWDNAI